MDRSTISNILDKFLRLKIMIIGDVMLDSYLFGKVSRISPEAPVPVVNNTYLEYRPGGAANVAMNVVSLGAEAYICSVIGTDAEGAIFKDLIRKANMSEIGLIETPERITTSKTRILGGHQQLLRIDREEEKYLDAGLEDRVWTRIQDILINEQISAVIFQDYDKGVITPSLITKVINLCLEKQIPTLVDPKKRNFNRYRNATLFKPNLKELCEGMSLGFDKSDHEGILKAARRLRENAGFSMVMVTLSEQGLLICSGDEFHIVPTHARNVADVSGAGDTVIAMAGLCLSVGMDLNEMAFLTNLAAGLVCEKVGVVPVEKEWLLQF